jgi:hypothetical protein
MPPAISQYFPHVLTSEEAALMIAIIRIIRGPDPVPDQYTLLPGEVATIASQAAVALIRYMASFEASPPAIAPEVFSKMAALGFAFLSNSTQTAPRRPPHCIQYAGRTICVPIPSLHPGTLG